MILSSEEILSKNSQVHYDRKFWPILSQSCPLTNSYTVISESPECKPCNHEDMSFITDTFVCNNQNTLAMEKEIRTANVYNLIILDESGSMHSF